MSLLRNITSGLRSLFRKEQVDRELDEELGAYLEMAGFAHSTFIVEKQILRNIP